MRQTELPMAFVGKKQYEKPQILIEQNTEHYECNRHFERRLLPKYPIFL